MTSRSLRRSLAAAAIATSLVLGACGAPEPEETIPAAPSEVVTSEPVESAAPEETLDTSPSAPVESMEQAATVETGPLEGDDLNDAGVEWFTTYCSGLAGALANAEPDVNGLEKDEVIATIAESYGVIGGKFITHATDLDNLDDDINFENSEGFAAEVIMTMAQVGDRYIAGGAEVADGEFAQPEDLGIVITSIEGDVAVLAGESFGLQNLDSTVLAAMGQIPECLAVDS